MNKPKIHFQIAKDGNVTVMDVKGAGTSCLETTSGIEKALGIVDEKSRATNASAYEDPEQIKLENTITE
jgi:hypothetical protein